MKQLQTQNGNGAPNGNSQNGGSNGTTARPLVMPVNGDAPMGDEGARTPHKPKPAPYDQAVILQQPSVWSRSIVWAIVGVSSFAVLWAGLAKIEQAVPAQGQLEPQASVQAIQAPVGGVVKEILVEEGDQVKKGQVLIRFDPTAAAAQLRSLEQIRDSLLQENAFYRSQMSGVAAPTSVAATIPPQVLALTTNRAGLLEENRMYRAQLGLAPGENLSPEQVARLQAGQQEATSRTAAAQLEVAQLRQQLVQAESQLAVARETAAIDENILGDIAPLVEEGALARIQVLRQQQEAMKGQAEVTRLEQEAGRLRVQIAQAQEKLSNTVALTSTDLLSKIAENEKQIANIDSQINKVIVENDKRAAEIDSQLSQTKLTLEYQELRAPVDGTVFDLKAKGIGFVANNQEPILKVVPANGLEAEVYITNQDIGFVREGMEVDVRVDSFPFSEFGDIKGVVTQIGDDALPPDQLHQFYRFPAKVELNSQTLEVDGKELQLQSGMSVSANIKIRKRSVLSIFTDMFTRSLDPIQNVR
ncbi:MULTISPECIES: HlyD family efflux transporter periplasmic adaptor subunit [unclassified Leptolyngbya]|uniref:HlyD family efflux transporter periplasmic adaptor subunit n=1 Tax=unclassified Leptolyngbya TaxID=2650499 RepID=UPI0016823E5A|nr:MULTISPECIES: HlyD family efflux transporter periplasmic adaptor subunit [unclassified Leptolyngbya]MBD1913524.1 HlyD family efflux transporter periplasmic adaptor subunit [Leptolyngbya sp. FACHB-8]MBD2153254.1 HlyD family efflux transporter periplasmic adaptor subunit [Leptolyngbya sp. FACHB-16]